jgi:renalase
MTDVIVVGAGICGLMAATVLYEAGLTPLVLDKGRGVGGRMATRRLGVPGGQSATLDHGAQFFTLKNALFAPWVEAWLAAGVIRPWWADPYPRYVGVGAMTAVPKHLAQRLNVRVSARVTQVHQSEAGDWQVETEGGEQFQAQHLLMTAPLPQTLALLPPLPPLEGLQQIQYSPCLAVMVVLPECDFRLPAPGGLKIDSEPLAWIAQNDLKGLSSAQPALTLHAGPETSTALWDAPEEEVIATLLQAARQQFEIPWAPVAQQVMRWRYAFPKNPHSQLFVQPAPGLWLAGDAFGGGRVEGAALSGLAVADALQAVQ